MMTFQELKNELKNQYKGHDAECTFKDFVQSRESEGVADGHSFFAWLFGDDNLSHADYWGLNDEQQEYWDNFNDFIKDYTYDVCFDSSDSSDSEGWSVPYQECLDYIQLYNGTNESYFEDYKGGVVSILCNETEEMVYEERIK